MPKNLNQVIPSSPKKGYTTPKIKELGCVRLLTLKIGSNVDSFGGNFA